MQVVVLAGGLGTRLRPITESIPKCMALVGGKPFLFYLLRLLKARGADEAVLCTGYLGEQVEDYFGSGKAIGLKLRYSRETQSLLGTGGALRLALPLLRDSFLVVNGDTYLDIDYETVYNGFVKNEVDALIVAASCGDTARCDLAIDKNLFVTRYDKTADTGLDYINAGVMALRREVITAIEEGRYVSLESEVFPALINRRQVMASITGQPFYDIGSFAILGMFERFIKETTE